MRWRRRRRSLAVVVAERDVDGGGVRTGKRAPCQLWRGCGGAVASAAPVCSRGLHARSQRSPGHCSPAHPSTHPPSLLSLFC
eukprot:557288-Prymnesium_polylepis.1